MTLKTLSVAVGAFISSVAMALGQQTSPAFSVPAAAQSQADCTGFITKSQVPGDIVVRDGADNDLGSSIRQYVPGESIYLHSRHKGTFAVGEEFSLVRPGKVTFRTSQYEGEHASLDKLGKPYEDVGRVGVTQLTPVGAIAEVRFFCGPIYAGDIAVPYQPRIIPEYVPAEPDRFAPPNGKRLGSITAARDNYPILRPGDIAYLNLGERDGAKAGQRYRVFYTPPPQSRFALFVYNQLPRETVGEVLVLSTQEKSSVAIVVDCRRDIDVGYGVELE